MVGDVKEKRLALNDAKAARHSLARIIRMRLRGELESDVYRDLVYGLNALLGFEKLQKETELEKRLTELEGRRGEQSNIILITSDERERRIFELMQKAGYVKAEKPLPQADVPPAPDPGPTIPESPELPEQPQPEQIQPEQPQPRRLKG
jgi:type IV secretory pathway VirB10-like protein